MSEKTSVASLFKSIEGYETQVSQGIDELLEKKKAIDDQIEKLNQFYHGITGNWYVNPPATTDTGEPRKRHTKDELKGIASSIVTYLKDNPNSNGSTIKTKFPEVKGSIKDFVKKWNGTELKSKGDKRTMTYSL
jgi:hypothetical protein